MTNPLKNFKILEKDLLVHGISIIYDYEMAVTAFENQDYEKYGEYLGKILSLATTDKEAESLFLY